MTILVNSKVTVSNFDHDIGSNIPIAYGPMMIPNAVDTTIDKNNISDCTKKKKEKTYATYVEVRPMTYVPLLLPFNQQDYQTPHSNQH